jgi:hypothetical protein
MLVPPPGRFSIKTCWPQPFESRSPTTDRPLGFQLLSRLEAVARHADEREADCNHAAISSDSPLAASQMDEVFGSDRGSFQMSEDALRGWF